MERNLAVRWYSDLRRFLVALRYYICIPLNLEFHGRVEYNVVTPVNRPSRVLQLASANIN